jgi:hypothetical protein
MMPVRPFAPTIEDSETWLETMLARQGSMLNELAQISAVTPRDTLVSNPDAALPRIAAFLDATDLSTATEDALAWLVNRLGLFVACWFVARHGGSLKVQTDSRQRFYGHIVLTGMRPPVPADARLDPFAVAFDAVTANPRIPLGNLLTVAESELLRFGSP